MQHDEVTQHSHCQRDFYNYSISIFLNIIIETGTGADNVPNLCKCRVFIRQASVIYRGALWTHCL